mmetsp:Transcript_35458/g.89109  ORF Transcript_35458/g.89109 Transcript_35458/m.89109 type:complete len:268 (+) Transcript_35458:629-1432(+)|eukprot:CAMPEP_0177665566 /NCGR_PEP_ID=MMETSP0447-20121125/21118_1 /TAXON_ID=0 /ORGANISM="Stygamoeba regulata, Strain BSH-02190019" /LENGTH=267 /DNA_ID=CAMNT_0019171659 /DNA_START=590 /DNA_END=1393 /DNA_ORIENTATION=-
MAAVATPLATDAQSIASKSSTTEETSSSVRNTATVTATATATAATAADAETTTSEDSTPPAAAATSDATFTPDPSDLSIKHPLQNRWVLWYDNPGRKTSQASWGDHLKRIMDFDTVEDFWRLQNNVVAASQLAPGSNYHLFKDGVEPKWEDPANTQGGKWLLSQNAKGRHTTLDKRWLWTLLAVIGEAFSTDTHTDEICGAVVSIRKSNDRIAIWTKNASDKEITLHVGQVFKRVLELPEKQRLGYQVHNDALQHNSSFNNKNYYEV